MKMLRVVLTSMALSSAATLVIPSAAFSQITAAKAAATKAVAAQNANTATQIREGNSPTDQVRAEAAGTVAPSVPSPSKSSAIPTSITIDREVFSYASTGRRDPYASLMSTTEIRPLLSDLRLTAIAFDPAGNNSVAILRDNVTKEQHRVKVGQQLGRLRVASIKVKSVVFSIDEFGFNRQETLQVRSDTTKARTP
ncbi:MAG: hypothetical protein ABJB66_02445 [Gemmatimonadaceae bacterium]